MGNRQLNISSILKSLSEHRPVFHSEMDLQLHLAWDMKSLGADVRLECDPACFHGNAAIDVLLIRPHQVAIELKYKTRSLRHEDGSLAFQLKNQGAEPQARYDFWRDVSRLEAVVDHADPMASRGYAIFLTNNSSYWRLAGKDQTDAALRMSEGRVASGRLAWSPRTSAGTKAGRVKAIELSREYELHWTDYSELPGTHGLFRYLLLEVTRD